MQDFRLMGMQLLDEFFFSDFLFHFVLDIIIITIVARLIYFRVRKEQDYLLTLYLLNIIVFFVCYLLKHTALSIGFAFGIFAIFSILRYRTNTVPIKEMTYIFISISIAIINALSNSQISFAMFAFANLVIVLACFLIEKFWGSKELSRIVVYEKIDLIKPENRSMLLRDLKERTGLDIHRIEIGRINFLRDTANIRIFFSPFHKDNL